MGVVNVTPDSFSDGGRYLDPGAAIDHGRRLAAEGAQILDVGGESTRPGAADVAAKEELRRVLPVVEGRAVPCCLMHMLGTPRTMQDDPRYDDVVSEVKAFLEARLAFAVAEGVAEGRVMLDPGIGFGKTLDHNLELLARLDEIAALGRPVVVGASRKSFLGRITGREAADRAVATAAANVLALERGASVFRVHDVRETADALAVATATLAGRWPAKTPRTTTTTT